jgi:murein DD-endopeptidase MepM/ murein hydrolase activator NlpD
VIRKYFIALILVVFLFGNFAYAQSAEEIKVKIDEKNTQIKKLEEEITQYNKEVDAASTQAKTLQNTLKTLDLTKKKITTDINLTENKITKTSLTIGQLGTEIGKTQDQMEVNRKAIITALQNTQALEDIGLFQIFLSSKDIGDVWNEIDNTNQIQETIQEKSTELANLKKDMESKQSALTGQKKSLVTLKQDLSGKKQAVESTSQEKAAILAETKNKEATFAQLVKTKEEQKAQFEKEVYEFESQLNITIDKSGYPSPKHGILSWPLDTVVVTQKFGKTVGAEKLYVSGSHNGVDFRASTGTRVKNVLAGVVVGTGNTDAYPGCYSFGKWVMVKHENGLSTIYGHLSVISVTKGQVLDTGSLIGYSGNTGYSTGPHLHISVYATQGVRIEQYVNSIGCKQATIPLADVKAYLDPLSYFPSI